MTSLWRTTQPQPVSGSAFVRGVRTIEGFLRMSKRSHKLTRTARPTAKTISILFTLEPRQRKGRYEVISPVPVGRRSGGHNKRNPILAGLVTTSRRYNKDTGGKTGSWTTRSLGPLSAVKLVLCLPRLSLSARLRNASAKMGRLEGGWDDQCSCLLSRSGSCVRKLVTACVEFGATESRWLLLNTTTLVRRLTTEVHVIILNSAL
jgi:hypothetical protein